jgi:hypothetical protein
VNTDLEVLHSTLLTLRGLESGHGSYRTPNNYFPQVCLPSQSTYLYIYPVDRIFNARNSLLESSRTESIHHAEGWHNLSEENMRKVHDPSLTPLGREQALRLSEVFPKMENIQMIVASPIRRTIQTAFLVFDPVMEKKKLKLILLPEAQETSARKRTLGARAGNCSGNLAGRGLILSWYRKVGTAMKEIGIRAVKASVRVRNGPGNG